MTNVHSAGEFYSAFPERRINPFKPELRAVEGGNGPKHIWGYASIFEKLSRKLGGFVEKVDNRAFTASKANGFPDVVCRFNHNDDFLLGTVNARTCLIDVDGTGLIYDVVPPSFRGDIIELMERGDVAASSFAFRVAEGGDDWGLSDYNYPLRTLLDVDLVDVAPVTTPAYPDATSAVRSMDGAVRSLATKFDIEPAEIRSLLEANQGVRLFKRTDRQSALVPANSGGTGVITWGATTGTSTSLDNVQIITSSTGKPEASLDEQRLSLYEDEVRAKYDAAAMKKMGSSGEAMANAKGDPSYPIADEDDLHNAIHAVGRGHASHEAIRQHIISRAKALGLSHMLPADWTVDPMADSSDEKNSAEETAETSEDRAAKATYDDLETCGECDSPGQYGKHCTNCGTPMNPDSKMPGKFCSNCGSSTPTDSKRSEHECGTETPEERTDAPAKKTAAEKADDAEDAKDGEVDEADEEEDGEEPDGGEDDSKPDFLKKKAAKRHVIDDGESQLATLELQRRQRIAQLQEKRFDPYLSSE